MPQVQVLITAHANVNIGDRKSMATALHEAARNGHAACIGKPVLSLVLMVSAGLSLIASSYKS